MNITILNVAVETKPTQKGSYQVADVAYKNNSFGGKVEGKKVMSFGATKDTFSVLATAQPNDTYEVSVVKNEKGYNDWVSLAKAGAAVQTHASAPERGQQVSPAVRTSNFETPDERAKRQVFIIRQSSISSAIAALSVGSKQPLVKEGVVELAKYFESYVLGTGATGFDDLPPFDGGFSLNPDIS